MLGACVAQTPWTGELPSGIALQVPTSPVRLHALHDSPQPVSQQTPSTQWPVSQMSDGVQASPCCLTHDAGEIGVGEVERAAVAVVRDAEVVVG